MDKVLQPVSRPGYCVTGTSITVQANFFKFTPKSSTSSLQRFSLCYSPEVSASLSKQRERILLKAKSQVLEHIGKFVLANTMIVSTQTSSEFVVSSKFDDVDYSITITPTGELVTDQEIKHFYNKFFNTVQGSLKLVMIGRKFYNADQPTDLPQHKLTVWPGYCNSVGYYESGCLLNIDISHRVLRTVTIYDQILDLKKKNPNDFKSAACKLLLNSTVLTLYNKKCYKIDDIDWDMSPSSSFEKQGTNTDFKTYYTSRWGRDVCFEDQPLLKSKLKTMVCYLLPEFCVMTGLTDEIRSDFTVMKDLAQATKKEPRDRLRESIGLIKTLQNFPKTRDEIADWKLEISTDPMAIQAKVLPAGSVLMGDNNKFKINDSTGNFDRDIQRKMFSQPKLDKWGVFFCENDKKLVDQNLMSNLIQAVKSFQVLCDKPALFSVPSEKWQDWDRLLRSSINPSVRIIICVLPGNRGKSKLYDDLKRMTFSSFPVPTQVILTGTLKKDKGLRSVINKVLIQINAKIGGVPWALENLPFKQTPCMIIGIDVFKKPNSNSVLGFCATMDRDFSKYKSFPKVIAPGDLCVGIKNSVEEALLQFKTENKVFPAIVVVYRDGVSDSQRTAVVIDEVGAVRMGFEVVGSKNEGFKEPGLVYVVVNKRTNARFYWENSGVVGNPPLGTLVDKGVVEKSGFDFYVMPAKANQGSMTPTHFCVVFDNSGVQCDELQTLSYKLCYSYYNWSGSIRVPAPCQYAHKLAYNYGERSDKNGPPQPHVRWSSCMFLYFL